VNAKLAASVAAVGLYLYASHGHHLPRATAVTTAAHGGTLGCTGLERLWEQAGGSPAAARTAASVAMAESSGRQYAANTNGGRSTDRGYWQVNSIHGALSTYDAYGNARAAVRISHDGSDWSPWVTYNSAPTACAAEKEAMQHIQLSAPCPARRAQPCSPCSCWPSGRRPRGRSSWRWPSASP
jgi:hypothetical protein